jgi:hypothetical protein
MVLASCDETDEYPTGPDGKPYALHDLPPEAFPLEVRLYGRELELLWQAELEGPRALEVPGFSGAVGATLVVFGDGSYALHDVSTGRTATGHIT